MQDNRETDGLDAFFDAARKETAVPSGDLLARIATEAVAVQKGSGPTRQGPRYRSGWRGVLSAIGGWPSLAGLSVATLAGIWIGISPPASIEPISSFYLSAGQDYVAVDGALWLDKILEDI